MITGTRITGQYVVEIEHNAGASQVYYDTIDWCTENVPTTDWSYRGCITDHDGISMLSVWFYRFDDAVAFRLAMTP